MLRLPESCAHPLGVRRDALHNGASLTDLCISTELTPLALAVARVVQGEPAVTVSYRTASVGGECWWEATVAVDDDGTLLVTGFDLSDWHESLGDLTLRARTDPLTGLKNRAASLERIRSNVDTGIPCAVLLIDLDQFKFVNDSLGHDVGDIVLVEIGRRLLELSGTDRIIGRLGGDEFLIVCDFAGIDDAVALAEAARQAIRVPIAAGARSVSMTASIGVAGATDGHHQAEALLRDADVALYRAKATGRDRVECFSDESRNWMLHTDEVESALRQAFVRGQLKMYVQPIVDLTSRLVVGGEALVRWHRTDGSVAAPADFLDIATDCGLVGDIDMLMLDEVCAGLARLQREMQPSPRFVTVNASISLLARADLVEIVDRMLTAYKLAPSALCIEVPETVIARDRHIAVKHLHQLRELGVYVALDDFGTGWSSLGALRELPVDVLKIDRSFIAGLGRDAHDTAIVDSILSLAHAMGLHVIAEGVETWAQASELARLGCHTIQGWVFAPALAIDDFAEKSARAALDIPPARELHSRAARQRKATLRGERLFIDEFLHQLNVPRGTNA